MSLLKNSFELWLGLLRGRGDLWLHECVRRRGKLPIQFLLGITRQSIESNEYWIMIYYITTCCAKQSNQISTQVNWINPHFQTEWGPPCCVVVSAMPLLPGAEPIGEIWHCLLRKHDSYLRPVTARFVIFSAWRFRSWQTGVRHIAFAMWP